MPVAPVTNPREIHVWCILTRDPARKSTHPLHRNAVTAHCRRLELHFHFAHDRRRYTLLRVSARSELSNYPDVTVTHSKGLMLLDLPQSLLGHWTLSECYMKVKGAGYSVALDNFSFYLPRQDRVMSQTDPKFSEAPDYWHFSLGCRVVVAGGTDPVRTEPLRLVLKEVVPAVSDRAGALA